MGRFTVCDFCDQREHVDHVWTVDVDPVTGRGKSKCRRCRLDPHAVPAWDRLIAAELAVLRAPDDNAALQALRAARIDFVVAMRS